jgi:CarboxypepD_reg-like domain
MANDNNIKNFTAIDIEKYHKGQLSGKERHDLEKAALDDPFLADALEGYAVAGVNTAVDIADLKKRLEQRTHEAKVIPLNTGRPNNFKLLRAAVIIAFIAGAAFLAYQFTGNNKSNDIAQAEPKKTETIKAADSVAPATNPSSAATDNKNVTGTLTNAPAINTEKDQTVAAETKNFNDGNGAVRDEAAKIKDNIPAPVTVDVSKTPADKEKIPTVDDAVAKSKETVKQEAKSKPSTAFKKEAANKERAVTPGIQDKDVLNRNAAASRKADEQYSYNQSNVFRGRVTDASNVGVPFANVTNVQDKIGTYTDARGYFNLTSPDTLLNVQVRSIGFEENQVQLRNNVSNTQVVLQDDRKSLSEVVVSNQKPNAAARSKNNTMKLEEPEPADGWDNYDSYLANNLKEPEDLKTKQSIGTGIVELSFEVDKNGEPVKIKVEKSLCNTCDKEAIRLVKEGPKWKRNAKKGRTTVKVNF